MEGPSFFLFTNLYGGGGEVISTWGYKLNEKQSQSF